MDPLLTKIRCRPVGSRTGPVSAVRRGGAVSCIDFLAKKGWGKKVVTGPAQCIGSTHWFLYSDSCTYRRTYNSQE